MSQTTTFAVPTYQGARLRALAKQTGKAASAILGELIDAACEAAGVGVQGAEVRVERYAGADTYSVILFEAYRVELTAEALDALSDAFESVADAGGTFDLEHDFAVYRKGNGVILDVRAYSLRTRKMIPAHLPMSPDTARKIAKTIRETVA